jgi:hypothetical protein
MANSFLTVADIARDSSIVMANQLLTGNLISRDKEAKFTGSKVGDNIKVTVPMDMGEADEFSSSTNASGAVDAEIDLTLEKHFYKRVDLTSKQKSLQLADFTSQITVPAMRSLSKSTDKYFLNQMQVFRAGLAGTIGNRPSTVAHLVAGSKVLNDNFISRDNRIAIVDTTVEASLIQIAAFTSVDYGPDRAKAVADATLGRRFGYDFYVDPLLGAFSRSAAAADITGTTITNGTTLVDATTVAIDGITNATGTIYAGTSILLAGDTQRYIVRKDATIASNATTLTIYPKIKIEAADGTAVSFEDAGYMNIGYSKNAITGAIVAPTPLAGGNSVVQSYNGISVRVSQDSSISTLADSIVYDCFVGARVIQPEGGVLICG